MIGPIIMFLEQYFVVFLYIEVIVLIYGFIQALKLQEFGTYLAYLTMQKNVRLSTQSISVGGMAGGFSTFIALRVMLRRFSIVSAISVENGDHDLVAPW